MLVQYGQLKIYIKKICQSLKIEKFFLSL